MAKCLNWTGSRNSHLFLSVANWTRCKRHTCYWWWIGWWAHFTIVVDARSGTAAMVVSHIYTKVIIQIQQSSSAVKLAEPLERWFVERNQTLQWLFLKQPRIRSRHWWGVTYLFCVVSADGWWWWCCHGGSRNTSIIINRIINWTNRFVRKLTWTWYKWLLWQNKLPTPPFAELVLKLNREEIRLYAGLCMLGTEEKNGKNSG